ncbi:MAG TPA: hypothetical protein VES95_11505 [Dermatophilaceae bacterium]|nr:hypothetical protein [Dermatophilaceae bacterium]
MAKADLADHRRPEGATDATVEAVGKLSEAFEAVEELRGKLYGLHRLVGRADFQVEEACELLRKAGHEELAEEIETELMGRNLLAGRWTFQIVEEFDDGYYATFSQFERKVRDTLMEGRRHVFEAEMKADRRTHGEAGHEPEPGRTD